jgi:hypothetical protein
MRVTDSQPPRLPQSPSEESRVAPERTEGKRMTSSRGGLRRLLDADVIFSAVLFGIFLFAYLQAQDWPFRTRLFPTLVSTAGMALALLKIGTALFRRRRETIRHEHRIGDVELSDEDEEADQELEYVFARSSRAEWSAALGWVVVFFVGLYFVGAILTVLAFTVVYLLFVAKSRWWVAGAYALLLAVALYGMQSVLGVSLPPGVLFE